MSKVYYKISGLDLSIIELSENVLELTGYPKSFFIENKTWAGIIDFTTRLLSVDKMKRLKNGDVLEENILIETKDQHKKLVSHKVTRVDERGIPFFNGEIEEILISSEALEKVFELTERFEKSFKYGGIGIALVGTDGKWIVVNQALCKMLGYNEQEIYKKNWKEITHPDDLEKDIIETNNLFEQIIPSYTVEKRYLKKNGDIVWVLITGTLVTDAKGKPQYAIAQVVDITRLKEQEEQLKQLNKTKDRILAAVVHDLRAPIGNISTITDFLLESVEGDENKELLNACKELCNKLLNIISDLLLISSLKHDSETAESTNVELTINRTLAHFAALSKQKGIQLKMNKNFTNGSIKIAATKFERILENLLSNAIKFTPRGGKVEVNVKPKPECFEFEVKDTGIGIPKHLQPIVFDMFTKAKRPGLEGEQTTGIGLSLIKELIQNHGGKIWLESEEEKGTSIKFTLPKAIEI